MEKVLAIAAQFLNKVQRIKDRQEHIPFSEEIGEIYLPHLAAIIGDGHTVALTGAGQLMERPVFIHKPHADEQVRIILAVEPVNAVLSEKGRPVTAKAMASAMLLLPRPLPPVMTVGSPKVRSVG